MNRKEERQKQILELLHSSGGTVLQEQLREVCGVTSETIRKDLIELEAQHRIRRVLGGAVLTQDPDERPFLHRYYENLDAKTEIARTAARLISERDFVAMDAGSTNLCLAMNLPDRKTTVLTNSLDIAGELGKNPSVRVFVAGGEYRRTNRSMTGESTERNLRNYHVNKVFLTCEGVSLTHGIMDAHESECRVKRAMLAIADEVYLLADHTKFTVMTPIYFEPLTVLTALITDAALPKATAAAYRAAGVRLITGPMD